MTDQKKSAEDHRQHHASFVDAVPGAAFFGMFRTEALKMADQTEKAVDRTMVEVKRAQIDSSRLFETQLEMQAAMSRAMFDNVRRAFNF